MFSPKEIERYARHIVLHGVGGPGQQKLKAARVLVIGAGGLGSPLLQYLTAAGVGEIGIVDDDEVSLSNLQRQVLYGTADIGRAKVESASAAIARLNPHVKVTALHARLTRDNARAMAGAFDVVADGSGIFLPGFVLVAVSGPLLPRLRGSAFAAAALEGVVAGSLALMAVVTWQLGKASLVDWTTLVVFGVSLIALLRFRVNSAWVIAAAAVVGWVMR